MTILHLQIIAAILALCVIAITFCYERIMAKQKQQIDSLIKRVKELEEWEALK